MPVLLFASMKYSYSRREIIVRYRSHPSKAEERLNERQEAVLCQAAYSREIVRPDVKRTARRDVLSDG